MIQPLQINSTTIAEIEVERLQGKNALGKFTLEFWLKFHFKYSTPVNLFNMGGNLKVRFRQDQQQLEHNIGIIEFEKSKQALKPELYSSLICYYYFTPEQITEIEKRRNGGDIEFLIQLHCLAEEFQNEKFVESHAGFERTVNQKNWLDILRQMGYTDYLLVEIPIPILNNSSSFNEIVKKYRVARDNLMNGEYTLAVNQCRLVLEGLEKKLDREIRVADLKKNISDNPKKMKLLERFDLIHYSLKHSTQLAHHTNQEGDEATFTEYSRPQAQLIVGNTGLLLSYYLNIQKRKA